MKREKREAKRDLGMQAARQCGVRCTDSLFCLAVACRLRNPPAHRCPDVQCMCWSKHYNKHTHETSQIDTQQAQSTKRRTTTTTGGGDNKQAHVLFDEVVGLQVVVYFEVVIPVRSNQIPRRHMAAGDLANLAHVRHNASRRNRQRQLA